MSGLTSSSSRTVSDATLRRWMRTALDAAIDGAQRGEHPFGAAIYSAQGELISVACNTAASLKSPLAHAEINAIVQACEALGQPKLDGYCLLSTAEPCPMCLSSAVTAGIQWIAFGASQAGVTEAGYGDLGISGRQLAQQFHPQLTLTGSVLGNECLSFLLSHRKKPRASCGSSLFKAKS